MKPMAVYDRLTRKRLAFLENAFDIEFTQQTNAVWTASFKLQYSDLKKYQCLPLNYIDIWDIDAANNDKYIGLFRIMSIEIKYGSKEASYIHYTLEHVMGTLLDSYRLTSHDPVLRSVSLQIEETLQFQNQQHWILGECDYDDEFEFEYEETNLLQIINTTVNRLTEDYYWSFDTQNFPWMLNLKKVLTNPIADIRHQKNILGLTKKIDPRSICTRLYLFGKNKLDISSINDGLPYLDSPEGIAKYGIVTLVINDERIENVQNLYDFGTSLIAKLDKTFITYDVDIQAVYTAANLKIGDRVRVITEDGLDEVLIVQEITKTDLSKNPKNGKIIIGHGTVELGLIIKSFI